MRQLRPAGLTSRGERVFTVEQCRRLVELDEALAMRNAMLMRLARIWVRNATHRAKTNDEGRLLFDLAILGAIVECWDVGLEMDVRKMLGALKVDA